MRKDQLRNRTSKFLFGIALTGGALAPQVSVATITAYDQYMLELINQGRAAPQAEADTYLSGDLNEGPPSSSISTTPKQALAFDTRLDSAAESHSNDMATNQYFAHNSPTDGSTPFTRMDAAGYSPASGSRGENIAVTSTTAADVTAGTVLSMYQNLFIDSGISGRGHRLNLMNDAYESIGISVVHASDSGSIFGSTSFPVDFATQNFGYDNDGISYLTGVAYDDQDANNFFTPGEELGSLAVTAFVAGTNTVAGSTTTFGSGGYTLGLADGTYDLQIVGSLGTFTQSGITLAGQNQKFDYTNSTVTAVPLPPAVFLMLGGLLPLARLAKTKIEVV